MLICCGFSVFVWSGFLMLSGLVTLCLSGLITLYLSGFGYSVVCFSSIYPFGIFKLFYICQILLFCVWSGYFVFACCGYFVIFRCICSVFVWSDCSVCQLVSMIYHKLDYTFSIFSSVSHVASGYDFRMSLEIIYARNCDLSAFIYQGPTVSKLIDVNMNLVIPMSLIVSELIPCIL